MHNSHKSYISIADKLKKASHEFNLMDHFNSIAEFTHSLNKNKIGQWFLNLIDYLIFLC